jgi:hypothetical protein
VTLKLPANAAWNTNDVDVTVLGTLVASGTMDARVTLTSESDDSVGGDTNGDGAASRPAPGDWGRLRVEGGTVRLLFADVSWGGGANAGQCCAGSPPADAAVSVVGTLDLVAGSVRHSQSDGVRVGGGSGVLRDTLFADNGGYGVHFAGGCDGWTVEGNSLSGNVSGDSVQGCP